ncbi:MAG: hypothetical protein ABI939_11835 [Anaerolineaceae bacterium]
MTYLGRVGVSYRDRLTKLERLRLVDAEGERLHGGLEQSEKLWETSGKSQDERLHACIQVAGAVTTFAANTGVSLYAKERLNDLLVALGELISGRHSVLLTPSPVHPGKFSATDLMQQAMAQVCVDVLREAGAGATEARAHVSNLFEKHQLPKFSEAKLRTLNSRLKGPGSSQDEAYGLYVWAREHADWTANALSLNPTASVTTAAEFADSLIGLAKRRDHRRDFFFAPREDSSPTR